MAPSSRDAKPTRGDLLLALLPVALTVAAYARSLRGEFQFDDLKGIAANGAIKALGPWLRTSLLPELFGGSRPLTTLTFAVNYAVGRLDPIGYHAVNLALHLAVVALVAALTSRVAALAGAERPRRLAAAVAGLFAVHPLQTQAVAYVSQRAEVLASAFYVATLLLLFHERASTGRRGWALRFAAFLAFVLGLAAKPILVTLPVAWLLLLLAAPPPEPSPGAPAPRWRPRLLALAPIAVAGAAAALLLLASIRGSIHVGFSTVGTDPWRYLLTQLRVILVYLRLLFFPVGQCVDWVFPTSPGLSDPTTLAAGAAVAAILVSALVLLLRGRRRNDAAGATMRLGGAGILWFFVVLSVTSSFVPLADNLFEHRVYLASWGIFLAVAAAVDHVASRSGAPRAAEGAWLAAVLLLAAALFLRTPVWASREALWADAASKFPENPRAWMSLGYAYQEKGRLDETIRAYQLALRLSPGLDEFRTQTLRNLGGAYLLAGRRPEAAQALQLGLQLQPDNPELLINMAILHGGAGDAANAERYARRVVELRPWMPEGWILLGKLALERRDWTGALVPLDRAVALDPDRGDAQLNRALVFRQLGRTVEECAAIRAALQARLMPQDVTMVRAELARRCP